ncbi:IS110 family transposase [Neisseria lisongii]|uniref:IS110 family transposase n=1 Tax=Neisseria lisongii TaxID=2912188 RepID=A0ABY7RH56_9NEIS|nr:IS110 family transposase [Neisseria lisongii]WCL70894.1 IS110 family transposase [Neisseria lisongii]
MMDTPFYFIGIDIAKLKFDVAVKKSAKVYQHHQFENHPKGFAALSEWLNSFSDKPLYIVMEATNVYHERLCEYLYTAGHSVVVINPKCAANFAKGLNLRSKTDKADAKLLARLAESYVHEFDLWQPKGNNEKALLRQLRHLEHLKAALTKEKVRLQMLLDEYAMVSSERLIAFLECEVKTVETHIHQLVKQDEQLKHNHRLLSSIPAIGKTTACWLLAILGDGTRFKNGRAAATYAGLTPMVRQSGTSVDKRVGISRIGQSDLRKILYMPAMVFCFGIHKDSIYSPFVQRLLERNKLAKKAVIVALMRKLVTIAQSVLKYQQPFNEERYAKMCLDKA